MECVYKFYTKLRNGRLVIFVLYHVFYLKYLKKLTRYRSTPIKVFCRLLIPGFYENGSAVCNSFFEVKSKGEILPAYTFVGCPRIL